MTTEQEKRAITYSNIVTNLIALRDNVQESSHEEAIAIDRIISEVMAVQVYDRYIREIGMGRTSN